MKKILSLVLSVLMLISILPMTAGAAATDTWDILTFMQDGPEFSVVAEGFEAADTSYTFTAVAYKGAEVADTKTVAAVLAGDKLSASVNFEEGGVEADVAISSVEVTLTNSSSEVVGETKTFAVTPQSVDVNGVYNNLTNGFYKPVIDGASVSVSSCTRYVWNSSNSMLGGWGEGSAGAYNLHDSNPSTRSANGGGIGAGNHGQYITMLSAAANVDRVIAYPQTGNGMEFYLAKTISTSNGATHLARFAGENSDSGICFLGDKDTVSGTTAGGATRLVMDADGDSYQYLICDMISANGDVYALYDFTPYQKVTNSYAVTSNKPDGAFYKQDGSVFSVVTRGLDRVNGTVCTLTANAYDAEGNRLAKKVATGTVSEGALLISLDFEEDGREASNDITKVDLTLTDDNGAVAEPASFAITKAADSLTNGFYVPVINDSTVTVSSVTRYAWTASNSTMIGGWGESVGGIYTMHDNDITTQTANGGGIGATNRAQYVTKLSAATEIDRVVAYIPANNGQYFYLAKDVSLPGSVHEAYLNSFAADSTTSDNLCYLGAHNATSGVTTDGVTKLSFKADGDSYQYLITDIPTGGIYKLFELQPYVGVKAQVDVQFATGGGGLDLGIPTGAVNVAKNAPAFSYGAATGSDASHAVDGNANTAWISANTSAYRDYLIIDLGAAYTVDALSLTMAEGSAQNFTVYGMNTLLNSERNSQQIGTAKNVSATEFERKALTGKLSGLSAGENVITSIQSFDKFRYLVFEQEAASSTNFGFAEIGVYTLDKVDAGYEAKPVSKAKGELVVLSRTSGSVDGDAKLAEAKVPVTDTDPSTAAGPVELSAGGGWNGEVAQTMMIDLGKAQKVSHVAYQGRTDDITSKAGYAAQDKYFLLVGANALPATGAEYYTKNGDNNAIASFNVDVLARYDGANDSTITMDGKYNDTGLLIFEVPEAYQNTAYRYVGIIKYESIDGHTSGLYTQIAVKAGSLHAYTRCEDVAEMVTESGANRIMETETMSVTADTVSYAATLWNGNVGGNVIGVLTNAETSQKYYVDCGVLVAGAYNSISFSQAVTDGTTGAWDLTLLCGNLIYDRICDLGAKRPQRVELYTGESISDGISFSRVGATAQSNGTVDAGEVGMVILKPGAPADAFKASDVLDHIFASAPAGINGAWNYSLRYTVEGGNIGDTYTACLLSCNDSLTSVPSIEIPIFDESAITAAFDAPAADVAALITTTYADFFGSDLAKDVAAITGDADAKAAYAEKFALAQVAFEESIFDEGLNTIDIISNAAQAALVIDATLTNTDIAKTVANYGASMPAIFDTADYDAADFAELLPAVLPALVKNTDATKANAENLATAYKRAIALSCIAGGNLRAVETAITTYSKELGIDELLAGTDHEPLSIAKEIANDMATVKTSYANGLKTAVTDIIAVLDENEEEKGYENVGSPAPNRTQGGYAPSPVPSLPYDLWDEQENAGEVTKEDSAISKETGFYDIDAHTWAHDAIKTMKERDIIDGVSDDAFDPDGMLTREQTAKLIVLSMNLKTTVEDNGYRDCVRGAWYYPFISSAKQHGLINGLSRTEFGLGKNITRQDLAVMIYRALNKLHLVDSKDVKTFADDAAISAYAKEAVGVLGNMGIITGFSDGSFGPDQNATRAQAAVIFARFLDIVDAAAAASAGEEG